MHHLMTIHPKPPTAPLDIPAVPNLTHKHPERSTDESLKTATLAVFHNILNRTGRSCRAIGFADATRSTVGWWSRPLRYLQSSAQLKTEECDRSSFKLGCDRTLIKARQLAAWKISCKIIDVVVGVVFS